MDNNALSFAVQNNLYALFQAMGTFPNATYDCRHGSQFHSVPGLLNPMFHGVLHTRLTEAQLAATLTDTHTFFTQREVPYWFWWHDSATVPPTIGETLVAHGYIPYEVAAPAMAVQIEALPTTIRTPTDFSIVVVNTEEDLQAWVDTFQVSFGVPAWATQSWYDATLHYGIGQSPWRLYLGKQGDTPVACSMLYCGGGVAGLIAVGTVPHARGQGLGKAITTRPLLDSRSEGYELGVLFSTEEGLSLYERLGFRQYGTISRYLHR